MAYKTKNGKWRAEKKINYVRKTKVFQTKKEAVAWEAAQTAELWAQEETPIHSVSCLEWGTQYLNMCKERYVSKTFEEKRLAFKLFLKSVGADFPVEELSPAISFRHMREQYKARSGNAANKDRKNLRAAWNWGVKYMGFPKENPFDIEKFPEKRTPRYVPLEGDMDKVLDVVGEADRAFLLTILHTAGRVGEILRLKWSDVDFQGRTITLYTRKRKGGNLEGDKVPMTGELFSVLKRHRATTNSIAYVFTNPRYEGMPYAGRDGFMESACQKAGVKYFDFHAIRHLSASMMAKAGVPLPTIQVILRHKAVTTTARYIHSLLGAGADLDGVFTLKKDTIKKVL